MANMVGRKLGKKPKRHDPRTLKLAKYLTTALPTPPTAIDNSTLIANWTMDLNDQYGDCTIASAAHLVDLWNAANKNPSIVPNDQVLSAYEAVGGFNPKDPSTDQGCALLDVLNYWKNTGMFGGNKILAYMSVNPKNLTEIWQAVYLFGGLYIGVELPITSQDQAEWTFVPNTPDNEAGSLGGHGIPIVGYTATALKVITWGAPLIMDNTFSMNYADEMYAVLDPTWLLNGKCPTGFDLPTLQSDILALT